MLSSKADVSVLLNGTQTNKVAVYEGIENILKRTTLTSKNLESLMQFFKKVLSDGNDDDKEELLRRWVKFSKNSKWLCVELIQEICNGVWNESIVKEIVGSLIVYQTLNLGECFTQINNDQLCRKIIETLIQISPSIPLKPYLNFIHIITIRSIFDTKDDSTHALLRLFVLRVIKSVEFGLEACDEQIRNHVLDNFKNIYIMIIEDLRKSNNRIWYDLCMFTLKYFGKLMHNEIGLLNALLSNIEYGFKSKIVEDKILSFECWKVLIEVASLDRNYLCSSKQLRLLIKPLKVKLSRNDLVTHKRLEVWLYLLTALQENSLQCLEEFMVFCFESETSIVKDVWLQRTEVFMNIIGHCEAGDCCISPRTFMLKKPLIDGLNILRYKKAVLNALTICSEHILIWEVKTGREKKIRCMWISTLRIISALHSLDKELILRDLFVVMTTFWKKNKENQEYFDDILQPIFNILSNLDSESFDYLLLNEIIVFPMAQLMLNTPDIPEYIALSFVNLLRGLKTGSVLEHLNRSCELLRSYLQNGTQVLSAYIWLELANEMLNVCRSPKDNQFEAFKNSLNFLMCWICECQIPKNLQKIICDKWMSIMTEIDVICEDFNTVILRHFQKILKDNPSFASNILGFIPFSIEKINEKSTINYVTKVLDVVLEILTIPCLNKDKVPLALPIISKISERIFKESDQNQYESLSLKLYECLEYFLKPHQIYDVLKLFKPILPKLSQSVKKRIPLKLCTIINDLTTHSNSEVAQNAIALMADLNKQRSPTPTTNFTTPSVSSRTAKIASLASANHKPLNLFAQTVQNSPVTVKGSVINSMGTPKSGRSLKIANAMPTFTKPNSINDANSQDFVYIDSEVKVDYSKMVSHQKEVLKRRKEDIPALYQDLSQSQHSYDSLSRSNDTLNVENKNGNDQKISESQSNVIILSNVVLSPEIFEKKVDVSPKCSFDSLGHSEINYEAKPSESESFSSTTDLSNLYIDENSIDESEGNEDKLIIQNKSIQKIKGDERVKRKKRGYRRSVCKVIKNKKEQVIKEKQIDSDKNEIRKSNRKSFSFVLSTIKTRSSSSKSNESNITKTQHKNEIDQNNSVNVNEEKSLNLDETVCSIDLIAQINNQFKDNKVDEENEKTNQLNMDVVEPEKLAQLDPSEQRLRRKRNTPKKILNRDKSNKLKEKHKMYKRKITPTKRDSVNINEENGSNLDETACSVDLITQINSQLKDNEENRKKKRKRAMNQLKMDIVGTEKLGQLDPSKQRLRRKRNSPRKELKRDTPNKLKEKHEIYKDNIQQMTPINDENNSENIVDTKELIDELKMNEENKELKDNPQTQNENVIEDNKNVDDMNETSSNTSLLNQSNVVINEGHNEDVNASFEHNSQESNDKVKKRGKTDSVNVNEEKGSNLDETACSIDLIAQINNQLKDSKVNEENRKTKRVMNQLKMDIVGMEKLGQLDPSMQRLRRKRNTPKKELKSDKPNKLKEKHKIYKENIQQITPINDENNSENIVDTKELIDELKMNTVVEENKELKENSQTQDENEIEDTKNVDDMNETSSNTSLLNQSNVVIDEEHNQDVNTSFERNSQESNGKVKKREKRDSVNVNEEEGSNLDETACSIDLITLKNNQFKDNKANEQNRITRREMVMNQSRSRKGRFIKRDQIVKRDPPLMHASVNLLNMDTEKLGQLDSSGQRLRRKRNTPKKQLKFQHITPINDENNSENIVDTEELIDELKMNTVAEENNKLKENLQTQDENEIKDDNKNTDENQSNIVIDEHNDDINTSFKNNSQESNDKISQKAKREISRLQMNIVGANSFVGVTRKRNSNMRSSDPFKHLIGVKKRRHSDTNMNNNDKKHRKSNTSDLNHVDGNDKKENETDVVLSECLLIQSTNKSNENEKDEMAKIDEDIIENSQPQNASMFPFSKSGIKLTNSSVIKNESNSPAYITFLSLLHNPSKDKNATACCDTNLINTDKLQIQTPLDQLANESSQNTLLIDFPDSPELSISIDFVAPNTKISKQELSLKSTKLSPKSIKNKMEQNTNQSLNATIMNTNKVDKDKDSINNDVRNEEKSTTPSLSTIALQKCNESNLFDQNNSINIDKLSPSKHNKQNIIESKKIPSNESLKSPLISSISNILKQILNNTPRADLNVPISKNLESMESNNLNDTLSCDPNESISVSIQEVSLPVEPTKIELIKTTPNPLGNITLDDFPTGLNKNDEQNLPASPILENRNSELLNNTIDISPIRLDDEGLKENNETGNKVESEIVSNNLDNPENCKVHSDSDFKFELPSDIAHFKSEVANNFMKAPSARSAKLMNLLPHQSVVNLRKSPKSVTVVRKQSANVSGSPTSTERVRRMMLNCNGNKNLEGEKDKVKNEEKYEIVHVLEFRRNIPSPFATPNRSILKRKASEALECGLSPGPKRKRVNFSDPPITAEKMYYKDEAEDMKSENDSCLSELNQRKSTPIYPPLINCPNDIKEVLKQINEDSNFYDNFLSLKLSTVGDLAKLTSTQVNQMEFLSNPKVSTIISALSAFADKYNSKEKLEEQVESSMVPSEDPSLPVNGDTENNALLVSPFERLKRANTDISDMWQNLMNICTRQELMLISEGLQEYLETI
ncbi:cytadherence high molecular weight protein 2-like isoform X1 [Onthophagus taurus]|uniref:cytadherence high molecular weight protein 2-like isoform X1 n=1 Tax=Onthophagus taurus TaxID=166361 RepID=UPI0039BE364D